ncbi:hypothetical protein D3C87_2012740 [compost metagenome]
MEEGPRTTEIIVNDVIVGKLVPETATSEIKTARFTLTQSLEAEKQLNIKIKGADQNRSHKILEIRILKNQ